MDILDYYIKLVDFLGEVMGEDTEVVLRDCRKPKHDIIAIANGHVSGRTVGAPITDFTLSILANEQWKEKDYVANYSGVANPNKKLRSSTFFIRENGLLVGQLCINVDLERYEVLSQQIQRLGGMHLLPQGEEELVCGKTVEHFSNDVIHELLEQTVTRTVGSCEELVRQRLTQEDRLSIVSELSRHGLFQLKGAVGEIAEYLYCSEASIYRYLSKVTKGKA